MTKTYVWYSKSTSITGKNLATSLGLSDNPSDRQSGTKIPPTGTTHVICWGARKPKNRVEFRRRNLERRTVINNPYLSEEFKNKYTALKKIGLVTDIPDVTLSKVEAREILISGSKVIGRKFYHQGGGHFDFIEDEMSLMNSDSDYFMEYLDEDDKREYRVHVFNGQIAKIQRKKPKLDENGEELEPLDYRCRSHNNGWRFSLCNISLVNDDIKDRAIKAVKALNLDFGAVDIIRIPSKDITKVLEVNTGMGLDNSGLAFYTQLFKDWIGD